MARKPRLDTRNGIYHVIAKGNDGCLLFRQPGDFLKFTHLLHDSRQKDPHLLLSYCLMPNHIHLLLETAEIPLSRIMHRMLLRYCIYFNKRYSRSGHLFQNRFKSKSCKQESYLLRLLVYIHDNPRKAGLVDNDGTYPYSSERFYQRKAAISEPVNNVRALELIGPTRRAAWNAYQYHLLHTRSENNGPSDSLETMLKAESSLFSDQEVYLEANPAPSPSMDSFDFLTNVPMDQICTKVADVMGVGIADIKSNNRGRKASKARSALIGMAIEAGWRQVDIIEMFGFHPGTIAYHSNRFREILDTQDIINLSDWLRKTSLKQ